MTLRASITLLAVSLAACAPRTEAAPAPTPETPQSQATAKSGAPHVVKLGYQKIGTPYLLKHRSESLDALLAKHDAKVEWVEFQAGPPLLEAMRAGAVDVGFVGETPPVFAQAGGVPFVYVATEPSAPRAEAIIVPRQSKLQSVAELKGKKVAVNRGSNVHYLLLRALEAAKLTLGDLEVVYLAPPDARAAFESGQIDAWVIWDPFFAAAEEAGARILRDGQGLVDNSFFYVARREFVEQQPMLLGLVLQEYRATSDWAGKHIEETAQILSNASGIAYPALLRQEKRHTYAVEPITPQVLAAQQRIADAFVKLDLIPREIQTREAFLAKASIGGGS